MSKEKVIIPSTKLKCDNCAKQLICKFRNPYKEDCPAWEKIEDKGVDYTSQITFK